MRRPAQLEYGPIPYTQVMASKTESLEVAYNTQEEVYTAMITELDDVIASLQDNLSSQRRIYNGPVFC